MDYAQSMTVVLLLIFVLLLWSYRSADPVERFDTYYNHDMGAQTIYGTNNTPDATLYAKYTWKETDPATGLNVYDKYYETHLAEVSYNDDYLGTAVFPASEMTLDKWPSTIFNGEPISLAQKNY